MAGIDRIGSAGRVSRDSASAGLEARDRKEAKDLEGAPQPRNQQVDEVAKMYEKQFLREMVRSMRGTVDFGMMKPSMAEDIFRGQLDDQYVESWGDQGGIGLADLIYNQVMDRFFDSPGGQSIKAKGQHIPLTDRDISRVSRMRPPPEGSGAPAGQVPLKVDVKRSADGSPAKLMAPWDSEVVAKARLEGGKTALTLKHGPNLRSTLIFQSVTTADAQAGAKLPQGRPVGILSPDAQSFFWNLNQTARDLDGGRGPALDL